MLIAFRVGNFLSFEEKQTFSMLFDRSKEDELNENEKKILKKAFIYGSNAAGKSNLIKAMMYSQAQIVGYDPLRDYTDVDFRMRTSESFFNNRVFEEEGNEESYFEYYLRTEMGTFSYGFEMATAGSIPTSEWLVEIKEDGSEEVIYELDIGRDDGIKDRKMDLYLYEFSRLNDLKAAKCRSVYDWFANDLIIKTYDSRDLGTIVSKKTLEKILGKMYNNEEEADESKGGLLYRYDTKIVGFKILEMIGFGIMNNVNYTNRVIKDIEKTAVTDEDDPYQLSFGHRLDGSMMDEGEYCILFRENRMECFEKNSIFDRRMQPVDPGSAEKYKRPKMAQEILFVHKNKYGTYSTQYENESDGTKRMIQLLLLINDSRIVNGIRHKNGIKTIIIDEIDRSLQTNVLEKMIKDYSQDKNIKTQLISTTHETKLMDFIDEKETWFISNKGNKSELYSRYQFELIDRKKNRDAYLSGAFGAIPRI